MINAGRGCACGPDCGCGAFSRAAMPGGGSCPSFVPAALVQACTQNRRAIETLGALLENVAAVLTSSVILAPTGAPLGAVGVVLLSLANGCDLGDSLKAQAKAAALGAKIAAVVLGVAAAVAIIPPATVAAPALAAAAAGVATLGPVFDALATGKAPKLSDIAKVAAMLPGLQSLPLSQMTKPVDDSVDRLISQATSGALKPLLQQVAGVVSLDKDSRDIAAVHDALLASITSASQRGHLAQNVANAAPAASNAVKQKVNRFVTNWNAAGAPTDAGAVGVWNTANADAPIPSAKLEAAGLDSHDVAVAAAKAKAKAATIKAVAKDAAKDKAKAATLAAAQKEVAKDAAKEKAKAATLAAAAAAADTGIAKITSAELATADAGGGWPTWAKVLAGVAGVGAAGGIVYAVTR